MACISAPTAILAGGALSAGGSIISGALGASAAKTAAQQQATAAQQAIGVQQQEFNTVQSNLAPYNLRGLESMNTLDNLLSPGGYLSTPISTTFAPTEATLAATPGYDFTLAQGEKAGQNVLAAQGLGRSGPAGIAMEKYATGLADTTYQDQFQNWYNQQQLQLSGRGQIYNQLAGLVTSGESAAAGTGTAAIQTGANIGSNLNTVGAATAAGTVGSTNALTGGISGVTGAASNTALLYALNNAGMFGASGAVPASVDYGGGGPIVNPSGVYSPTA